MSEEKNKNNESTSVMNENSTRIAGTMELMLNLLMSSVMASAQATGMNFKDYVNGSMFSLCAMLAKVYALSVDQPERPELKRLFIGACGEMMEQLIQRSIAVKKMSEVTASVTAPAPEGEDKKEEGPRENS